MYKYNLTLIRYGIENIYIISIFIRIFFINYSKVIDTSLS